MTAFTIQNQITLNHYFKNQITLNHYFNKIKIAIENKLWLSKATLNLSALS